MEIDSSNSLDSSWESDYVDLRMIFLSDEDAVRIYQRYPDLQSGQGCPTCKGVQVYRFDNQEHRCDCQLQLQLHKHYLRANIGLLYQRLTWDDFLGDLRAKSLSATWLSNHKKMIQTGMGVTFFGEFGVGKTLLASLIAKELVKMGYRVFFSTFAEMIDMFTKGWVSDSAKAYFEKQVVESDVFILDDVGKEFRSKNNLAESTFDHVLRSRAVDARPTLLTTNMSEGELGEGYGGAILSLLSERCVVCHTGGDDWRPKSRDRTLAEVLAAEVRPIV